MLKSGIDAPMRDCPAPQVDEQLNGGRDAPRAARRAMRALGACALPEWRRFDLDLLVTELVSNSLLHADPGPITLRATVSGDVLRVEVWDDGPGIERRPRRRMPSASAGQGRGLPLLERLADRWGTARADGRACVWFEMRPEAPPA